MTRQKIEIAPYTVVPGLKQPLILQESAARCTRCNACAQTCPAYLMNPQESFSPRGRVQLVRLLCEAKLSGKEERGLLKQISQSCLLCARCTTACAGKIPVAHHTLALRKALGLQLLPAGLCILLRLRQSAPKIFHFTASTGLALHRFFISSLFYPFIPDWLKHTYTLLPRKTGSLRRLLIQKQLPLCPDRPQALYWPSLYTQYIDPQAGLLSYQALPKPAVLFDLPSGLFEYLYGSHTCCLQAAKKVLLTWEKFSKKKPLPLITDSIEIYGFCKHYPLLFARIPGWCERAEKFAAQVQFITDKLSPAVQTNFTKQIALDTSSVLYPVSEIAKRARKILLATYGQNLLECEYSRFPLPAASIGFACKTEARSLVLKNIQDLAGKQIDRIYCLSAWAALELNAVLRQRKLKTQAQFIVHTQTDYE